MDKPEEVLILVVGEDVGREFINLLLMINTCCTTCYLFYGQTWGGSDLCCMWVCWAWRRPGGGRGSWAQRDRRSAELPAPGYQSSPTWIKYLSWHQILNFGLWTPLAYAYAPPRITSTTWWPATALYAMTARHPVQTSSSHFFIQYVMSQVCW